ncbi:unnamed protein product [Leptidea sinapis]|uniref:Uncharacterized protein n=1 Tax=Leptidea sinapis TaxID=189913 RepID=A0A5E4QD04_9NEOP|nr:unnamed protein product [Leptidea sinapis]
MSTDEYQLQDVYRYNRKSFKTRPTNTESYNVESRRENTDAVDTQTERVKFDAANCTKCDNDSDGEITSILHKKCPVIALAHQQLQRLLDETDNLLCLSMTFSAYARGY